MATVDSGSWVGNRKLPDAVVVDDNTSVEMTRLLPLLLLLLKFSSPFCRFESVLDLLVSAVMRV